MRRKVKKNGKTKTGFAGTEAGMKTAGPDGSRTDIWVPCKTAKQYYREEQSECNSIPISSSII